MGWGTEFKPDLYLNRMQFDNIHQVEDKIESLKTSIQKCKNEIMMYCSSNPRDIIPEDWRTEPMSFMVAEMDRLFEWLEEDLNTLKMLNIYKEYLEENDKV